VLQLYIDCRVTVFIFCHRTPSAAQAPLLSACDRASSSSSAIKCQAAPSTERFFKLLGYSTKKFAKSSLLSSHALASLKALRILLRLPNSRPLLRLCHKMKLVDPTLSSLVERRAVVGEEEEDVADGAAPLRYQAQRSVEEHELPRYNEDDDDDDDNIAEALMSDFGLPRSQFHPGMSGGGGGMHQSLGLPLRFSSSENFFLSGGGAPQHASPAGQPPSSLPSSTQEATSMLLSDLRELLLPFANSSVGVEGSEQLDAITHALLAAVTGQCSSSHAPASSFSSSSSSFASGDASAALSALRDIAQRGTLVEMLDSAAGLRLINALCAFMNDDAPASSGCTSIVLRREMFRSQFCCVEAAEGAGESRHAGLKLLLQHVLALFEENHNEVLALLERTAAAATCKQAQSPQVSGSFAIQLRPIPHDSGCQQHFGCASVAFSHNGSSDFKFVAGESNA